MRYFKKINRVISLLFFSQLIILSCRSDNSSEKLRKLNFDLTIVETQRVCVVTRIIDGDTFEILDKDTDYKVRLIGVDTPESSYNFKTKADAEKKGMSIKEITSMGKEATKFVKKLISVGDSIKLEFDVQQFDKYGRLLAYVYLTNGKMLNEILVREGYAQVMTVPPNVKYQDLFLEAQREARENNKGLWSASLVNHF